MSYQAVILVGGLGTRLRKIVTDVPKPMAQIENKPFLEYLIRLLKENGFKRFLFLTGYKSGNIESYFKNGEDFGIKIDYARETEPLGTGGAIFNAWGKLDDEFFLINGDTFFDIQYEILFNFIEDKNSDSLIALRYSNDISRYGFVKIDNEYQIKDFIEKSKLPNNCVDGYINGGVYYFKKCLLENFYKKYSNKKVSLENEILPYMVSNKKVFGLPVGGKFIDIGVPEDYLKAQKLIPLILKKERKPTLFVDRDGTIIEDKGYFYGSDFVLKKETIKIMKKAQQEGKLIIIITNQAGIAKGEFTEKESIETTEYLIKILKEYGINIDGYYYCPYHEEGIIEKYKKNSLLRKPEPGMILKACEDFRIDLKNSVMIGDNDKIDKIKLCYLHSEII
jgi:D,D-heptose 1,7-bisphosphate phosphatase